MVVGIFGQRGSGKSFTLGALLEGLGATDQTAGIGQNIGDRGVLVLDTLNIYQYGTIPVSKIADAELRKESARAAAVFGVKETEIRLDISYPAGYKEDFYPLSYESFALSTANILPDDYGHIFELDIYKDPMGQLLLAAFDAIKDSGYTAGGRFVGGSPNSGLTQLVECLENDPTISANFGQTTVRALVARLRTLLRNPLFSDVGTPLNALVRAGRVRVLLLGQLAPSVRSVVAALIVRQLFDQRAKAAEANKALRLNSQLTLEEQAAAKRITENMAPRTVLCIDEAQGYAPPTKDRPSTGVLIQFVKEGRNHGLSLVITSQQPSSIHPELLSQLDCAVSHRLTVASDVEAVLRNAKGRSPENISSGAQELDERGLIRELRTGQAWVSHIDAERSFVLEVRPRVTAHGGIEG
jgi:DNA helicase HerA-like ATPase